MLYRGYVETDGKSSKDKFKNGEKLKTLEEVKKLKSYGGVLNDNVILIDIDDETNADKLMDLVEAEQLNCKVYQTSRGKHFVFLNDGVKQNYTNVTLAVGIKADIKIGSKNSYQVLKKDGAERFVEWDSDTYDYLPKFLYPVKKGTDFSKMSKGSRNSKLYSYILVLQSYGFSKAEARRTIKLLNKFILDNPLNRDEIDTILRDESFAKEVLYVDGKFSYDKAARYFISEYNIKRINGVLHVYKDGIYKYGTLELERAINKKLPESSSTVRNELIKKIEIIVEYEHRLSSPNLIAFKNGVYNINTDEFTDFNPDYIITNKINWNYNPVSYAALTDEVLNNVSVNDKEIRMLIEEMIGYTFFRRNELRKSFILVGDRQNGKSTFLNMLKHLLGEENHSVLDIKKLSDRFSTIMLVNKLANIGDDISNEKINDTAQFKKIVSGEAIDVEQKGKDKFAFKPYCKLIYSANEIPKIGQGNDAGAVLSRLVIVPLKAKFDEQSKDFRPFISDDLHTEESMEYLINLGIAGLKRVLKNRKFTENKYTKQEIDNYKKEIDPLSEYLEGLKREELINEFTDKVYQEYVEYCLREGIEPVSKNSFGRYICNKFNLTTDVKRINNAQNRVFKEK